MDTDFRSTWETYVQAWKARSVEEKRGLLKASVAESCVYTDPLIQARGFDELTRYMDDFHRQIPGGHFVTNYFLAHHGKSIAKWTMVGGDGKPLGDGVSYGEYDDHGRLVAMTGFFEAPPS